MRKPCEWGLCSNSCISCSWQRPQARATDDTSGGVEAWAPWQPVHVGAFGLPAAKAWPCTLFCHLSNWSVRMSYLPIRSLSAWQPLHSFATFARFTGAVGDEGDWMSCLPWQLEQSGALVSPAAVSLPCRLRLNSAACPTVRRLLIRRMKAASL